MAERSFAKEVQKLQGSRQLKGKTFSGEGILATHQSAAGMLVSAMSAAIRARRSVI
jgi:hypothetical protein